MPADCWGAGSLQSTENQRAGCRGHEEAPRGSSQDAALLAEENVRARHTSAAGRGMCRRHLYCISLSNLELRHAACLGDRNPLQTDVSDGRRGLPVESGSSGTLWLCQTSWGFVKATNPREEVCLHTNQCPCQRGTVRFPGGCLPLEVNTPQACPRALAPSRIWTLSSSPGWHSACHLHVTRRGWGSRASTRASEGRVC